MDSINASSCYVKFSKPVSRYPYAGSGIALSASGGACSDTPVGFSGVGDWTFCDLGIEAALNGQALNETIIAAAAKKASEANSVLSDHFVSVEYRRKMARVFPKRQSP